MNPATLLFSILPVSYTFDLQIEQIEQIEKKWYTECFLPLPLLILLLLLLLRLLI